LGLSPSQQPAGPTSRPPPPSPPLDLLLLPHLVGPPPPPRCCSALRAPPASRILSLVPVTELLLVAAASSASRGSHVWTCGLDHLRESQAIATESRPPEMDGAVGREGAAEARLDLVASTADGRDGGAVTELCNPRDSEQGPQPRRWASCGRNGERAAAEEERSRRASCGGVDLDPRHLLHGCRRKSCRRLLPSAQIPSTTLPPPFPRRESSVCTHRRAAGRPPHGKTEEGDPGTVAAAPVRVEETRRPCELAAPQPSSEQGAIVRRREAGSKARHQGGRVENGPAAAGEEGEKRRRGSPRSMPARESTAWAECARGTAFAGRRTFSLHCFLLSPSCILVVCRRRSTYLLEMV
jgi:hypothetical protein